MKNVLPNCANSKLIFGRTLSTFNSRVVTTTNQLPFMASLYSKEIVKRTDLTLLGRPVSFGLPEPVKDQNYVNIPIQRDMPSLTRPKKITDTKTAIIMQLDSVLRKRRKKMKKHKLRKRRKRERAEKRKLSQGR